jgi:uncharacterized circularly permuted ATP-grasp superfamily protein
MLMLNGFGITCGNCKHVADMDGFTKTISGIDLPNGDYQCPSCGIAWSVRPDGKAQVFDDGYVIPAKRKVVLIDRTL